MPLPSVTKRDKQERAGVRSGPKTRRPTSRPLTIPRRVDGISRRCNEGTLLVLFGWDPQTLLDTPWTYGTQRFFGEVTATGCGNARRRRKRWDLQAVKTAQGGHARWGVATDLETGAVAAVRVADSATSYTSFVGLRGSRYATLKLDGDYEGASSGRPTTGTNGSPVGQGATLGREKIVDPQPHGCL